MASDGFIDIDNLYYVATMALKWSDETFWEASPRFLFSQLDIHKKAFNKDNSDKKIVKNNDYSLERRKEGSKIITVEKKRLKVL